LSALYDTVCVTDDANVTPGNCDGQGSSYSAQALAANGITPGSTVSVDGLNFTWPDVPAGQADAVSTPGTQIPLSGTFDQIGLLFSSMAGNYAFTFDYADGTTSTQTVSLPGWVNSTATPDTTLVDQFAYRNRPNGQDSQYHPDLFLLVLQPQAKPLTALVLPTTGRVDLFALAN
jgi:beta-glucosidase